jgi:flavorubredoxin
VKYIRGQYKMTDNTIGVFIKEVYGAFGWQGGTIHQIKAEIKRLQDIEKKYIEIKKIVKEK